jgi:uncharacterized membrane protein YcaP (DUF421 family)
MYTVAMKIESEPDIPVPASGRAIAIQILAAISAMIAHLFYPNVLFSLFTGIAVLLISWGVVNFVSSRKSRVRFNELCNMKWIWWY